MANDYKDLTLRDLMLIADSQSSPALKIQLERVASNTYEGKLSCLRRAVDYLALEISKTPQNSYKLSEDELTDKLILGLKSMGYQASHDTQYGGHCDIVVEERNDFLWIAEAKIHGSYDWLMKGFQQLTTRYATGLKNQNNGELIIYIKQENIKNIMDKWRDFLSTSIPSISISESKSGDFHFSSSHTIERTGTAFGVRHLPISVYFKPLA